MSDKYDPSVIKVIDKRRFSSDGNVRDDAPREDPRKPTVSPAAQQAAQQAQQTQQSQPQIGRGAGEAPANASGIDFINFVASLATSALASLGLLPEARARGIPTNVQAAREYIDVIGMLQEKTRGNLSQEEDTSLGRLLGELRAQYVQVTRAQAQAEAQAAAQRIPGAHGMPPGVPPGMPRPPGR